MKRLLFLVLLLPMALMVDARSLVLVLSDSTKVYFLLDENPVMAFKAGQITVSNQHYSFEQFDRFYISETDDPAGIETALAQQGLRLESGMVVVDGAPASVSVYAIDGKRMRVDVQRCGSQTTVRLSGLPHGTYIVKAGTSTLKFNKK